MRLVRTSTVSQPHPGVLGGHGVFLVVCDNTDEAALWAYDLLRTRLPCPAELVTSEDLASAVLWEHSLDSEGVSVGFHTCDGLSVKSSEVKGVLNRLICLPQEHLALAHPDDRSYMEQELTAFYASWLHALPRPVINLPTPQGLCGRWRHISHWLELARRAGLMTPYYERNSKEIRPAAEGRGALHSSESHTVTAFAVGQAVVGPQLPPTVRAACRRLRRYAETELLGISLIPSVQGAWMFAGATPWPDLRLGGTALIDVLAAALSNGDSHA